MDFKKHRHTRHKPFIVRFVLQNTILQTKKTLQLTVQGWSTKILKAIWLHCRPRCNGRMRELICLLPSLVMGARVFWAVRQLEVAVRATVGSSGDSSAELVRVLLSLSKDSFSATVSEGRYDHPTQIMIPTILWWQWWAGSDYIIIDVCMYVCMETSPEAPCQAASYTQVNLMALSFDFSLRMAWNMPRSHRSVFI